MLLALNILNAMSCKKNHTEIGPKLFLEIALTQARISFFLPSDVSPTMNIIAARFIELHVLGLGHMEEPFFCNHLAVLRVLVP